MPPTKNVALSDAVLTVERRSSFVPPIEAHDTVAAGRWLPIEDVLVIQSKKVAPAGWGRPGLCGQVLPRDDFPVAGQSRHVEPVEDRLPGNLMIAEQPIGADTQEYQVVLDEVGSASRNRRAAKRV